MPSRRDASSARPLRRGQALLARANGRFESTCLNSTVDRSHCKSMGPTLRAYAAFHRRVFAADTPCAERRVLIVRESFSDIVGVGHAHMGLQRFLAVALALGRAVVFSHCSSREDPWQVTGRALWKNAAAYACDEPHLSIGEHYVGFDGIDLRWSPERQRLLRECGFHEMALDLNDKRLPQVRNVASSPHIAFGACRKGWAGCLSGWNHDQMACDFRARAGCPDVTRLFGPPLNATDAASKPAGARRGANRREAGRRDAAHSGRRMQLEELAAAARPKKRKPVGAMSLKPSSRGRGSSSRRPITARAPVDKTSRGFQQRSEVTDFSPYAQANILALYNARRDGGAYAIPAWQMSIANGAASVGTPNGSTVGIASEPELRDTLSCPYSCWAHANFQPAAHLRRLVERASRKLSPSAPLTCAHLRTMWVDDHRCCPNPRGCQPVEYRRLVYWNTSSSIQHGTGSRLLPAGSARGALDGNPAHFSDTTGRRSPLWWRMEMQHPLPICRVVIRTRAAPSSSSSVHPWRSLRRGKGAAARLREELADSAASAELDASARNRSADEPPRRLRVSVVAADGLTIVWSGLTPLDPPRSTGTGAESGSLARSDSAGESGSGDGGGVDGRSWEISLPAPAKGKYVRIEMAFDEVAQHARVGGPARLSMQVEIFTDEKLDWAAVDRFVLPEPCRLVSWRGTCPGTFHKTMFPIIGGWSGFVDCVARSNAFRHGLLHAHHYHSKSGGARDPFTYARTVQGEGRRLATAEQSDAPRELAPVYFSTDSPAVQTLAMESYPGELVTIEGDPVPSWARNKSTADYAKVLADFEMLKLCEVIVGPVSSNYAKTAAVESMLSRGYLTQVGMCSNDLQHTRELGKSVASTKAFEQKRDVAGMFAQCVSQGADNGAAAPGVVWHGREV